MVSLGFSVHAEPAHQNQREFPFCCSVGSKNIFQSRARQGSTPFLLIVPFPVFQYVSQKEKHIDHSFGRKAKTTPSVRIPMATTPPINLFRTNHHPITGSVYWNTPRDFSAIPNVSGPARGSHSRYPRPLKSSWSNLPCGPYVRIAALRF